MSSVLLCVFPEMLFPNNAISGVQKPFSWTLKVVCAVVGVTVKDLQILCNLTGKGGWGQTNVDTQLVLDTVF